VVPPEVAIAFQFQNFGRAGCSVNDLPQYQHDNEKILKYKKGQYKFLSALSTPSKTISAAAAFF
jgi:hypothetical protein